MAERTPTVAGRKPVDNSFAGESSVIAWEGLLLNDTAGAIEYGALSDRSVQFSGTFGGATIALHGSNDGTNYIVLTDPQGNNISKTSAAIEAITEPTRYIKPVLTGGDGTTDIDVHVFARG